MYLQWYSDQQYVLSFHPSSNLSPSPYLLAFTSHFMRLVKKSVTSSLFCSLLMAEMSLPLLAPLSLSFFSFFSFFSFLSLSLDFFSFLCESFLLFLWESEWSGELSSRNDRSLISDVIAWYHYCFVDAKFQKLTFGYCLDLLLHDRRGDDRWAAIVAER